MAKATRQEEQFKMEKVVTKPACVVLELSFDEAELLKAVYGVLTAPDSFSFSVYNELRGAGVGSGNWEVVPDTYGITAKRTRDSDVEW